MIWKKYKNLEPIRRLQNEGRELLGKELYLTEKRDGENVSVWLNLETDEIQISSHNVEKADNDIARRMKLTPEYKKICELLRDDYHGGPFIFYGELLKQVGPTRIEPRRKYIHWIVFDVYNCSEERYFSYNAFYQMAFHFKLPVVRIIDFFVPLSIEFLEERVNKALKWCKRHRREGVVGKNYKDQIFFKEKIELPKLAKIRRHRKRPDLPDMPQEKIIRALQHAFDEVGEENWKVTKIAMPIVAKHFEVEGREHNYNPPRNFYKFYLDTTIDILKGEKNG